MPLKVLSVLVVALSLVFTAVAAEKKGVQVGFWFNVPEDIGGDTIKGVRFGLPIAAGWGVRGAELSLLASASRYVDGFQTTLLGFTSARTLHGCQLSLVNVVRENVRGRGAQIGLYNHSVAKGVQIGLINYCGDNAEVQVGLINVNLHGWMPVMLFVNLAR
ncbi:hypothetical protein SDC9_117571 [bioreactor metagenome]|uniref:Uncharacterized protein n=1 Tax=bioreactor metagenome TaxID=1076179 RepID=A0A645BYL2_9ZZZZ